MAPASFETSIASRRWPGKQCAAKPFHPVQLRADSLPILSMSMIFEASQERKKNREMIAASSFAESGVCCGAAAQRRAQPFVQRTL